MRTGLVAADAAGAPSAPAATVSAAPVNTVRRDGMTLTPLVMRRRLRDGDQAGRCGGDDEGRPGERDDSRLDTGGHPAPDHLCRALAVRLGRVCSRWPLSTSSWR